MGDVVHQYSTSFTAGQTQIEQNGHISISSSIGTHISWSEKETLKKKKKKKRAHGKIPYVFCVCEYGGKIDHSHSFAILVLASSEAYAFSFFSSK